MAPPEPPTALQSLTSPVKICSTCFLVRFLIGFAAFTMTATPSYATMVSFKVTPFAVAAAISSGFAGRLAMPICAVESISAAKPVVEPSAAISNVASGFWVLNCSASCGTSFAPSVSEPLMTRRSACAAVEARPAAATRAMSVVFIVDGFSIGFLLSLISHISAAAK